MALSDDLSTARSSSAVPLERGGCGRRRAKGSSLAAWRHGAIAAPAGAHHRRVWIVWRRAETSISLEYQVKAAFMYNFAKYVEWPPKSFLRRTGRLSSASSAEDPFGAELDQMLKIKKVTGDN